MDDIIVLGIYVRQTMVDVPQLQEIMTRYGCIIRTRLGLNNVVNTYAEPGGLILVELYGDWHECQRFENELLALDGLEVQKMSFRKDLPK